MKTQSKPNTCMCHCHYPNSSTGYCKHCTTPKQGTWYQLKPKECICGTPTNSPNFAYHFCTGHPPSSPLEERILERFEKRIVDLRVAVAKSPSRAMAAIMPVLEEDHKVTRKFISEVIADCRAEERETNMKAIVARLEMINLYSGKDSCPMCGLNYKELKIVLSKKL